MQGTYKKNLFNLESNQKYQASKVRHTSQELADLRVKEMKERESSKHKSYYEKTVRPIYQLQIAKLRKLSES